MNTQETPEMEGNVQEASLEQNIASEAPVAEVSSQEEVDYKRLYEEAAAEAERKEKLLVRSQKGIRKMGKQLSEYESQLRSSTAAGYSNYQIPQESDYSDVQFAMFGDDINTYKQDLVALIKEYNDPAVALNFATNPQQFRPEDIEPYLNLVKEQAKMNEENQLKAENDRLRKQLEEVQSMKQTQAQLDQARRNPQSLDPLGNDLGSGSTAQLGDINDFDSLSPQEQDRIIKELQAKGELPTDF